MASLPLRAAVALLLGTGACARVHVTPPSEEVRAPQTTAWVEEVTRLGETGDWLVIRGYKVGDDLVVAATNIPLSHAAVLDREREEVVESVATGVGRVPLEKFLDHAHRVLLIRPKWWTQERGLKAAEEAQRLVGNKYDWTGLVGASVPNRFYCSELAVHVYRDYVTKKDQVPAVIEPGQMFLWGRILFDSGPRN